MQVEVEVWKGSNHLHQPLLLLAPGTSHFLVRAPWVLSQERNEYRARLDGVFAAVAWLEPSRTPRAALVTWILGSEGGGWRLDNGGGGGEGEVLNPEPWNP